jgi:hypothetical protein
MFGVLSIATNLDITNGAKDFTDTVLNPEELPLKGVSIITFALRALTASGR